MSQLKAIVDKLLTQASSMLIPQGYVSEMILPPIYVQQKTGKLGKYGNNHLRIESTIAGGRGAYRRVEAITRTTDTYSVDSHGLEDIVTPDDRDNVEMPYDAELDTVMGLTNLLWLKKEKSLADTLTSQSIITQYTALTGVDQYSDKLNSDPIDDFTTARQTIRNACGFAPDLVTMDWAVFNQLRFHPQILDSLGFKQNRPGGLSIDEMAVAMGVKRVLIAEAVYNSSKEGAADVIAPVWGKHVVFMFSPDTAARYQTALGYRVQLSSQRGTPRRVTKYPIYNPPESTGIICEDHWDMFLSNTTCAYLIKDAIA